MALIVEDGTGVTGANSYGTIAGARSYASDRNITLGADNVVSSQLILGTDYLESFSQRYVGQQVNPLQSLSWPRNNVLLTCDIVFPNDEIPVQLVNALYECVIAQFNGIDLQPDVDYTEGGFIIEEKVDVIDTKYSEKVGTTSQPILTKVMALLSTLLNPGVALRTLRV